MLALLHNPVADMRGPDFLVLYIVVVIVTIVVCRVLSRASGSAVFDAGPEVPPDPDPYEVGYLRGGHNEVTRLAILSLMQAGYLREGTAAPQRHSRTAETPIEQAPGRPDLRALAPLEREVFDAFAIPRTAGEIFQKSVIPARIKGLTGEIQQKLVDEGLLASAAERLRAFGVTVLGASVILGLGGYKLAVALAKGKHNVGFLIAIGIIGLIVLAVTCGRQRITKRGVEYLVRLRLAFDGLKSQPAAESPGNVRGPAGLDPSVLVMASIFEFGMLAGTPYAHYQEMFRRSSHANMTSSCGSYAGSSCGSSCGSSDGGSSCGGGGCGGCGGGD